MSRYKTNYVSFATAPFERFYKGDKYHNQNGSGLGLSIAKEIIRNLGEEIYVSSKKGEKTRFEFTLHRNIDVSIV